MRGIEVILYEKTQTGVNTFNEPVFSERPVSVHDVLVSPSSAQDILDATNLYGRKAVYTLGIPKGDTHDWENRRVSFFGDDWKTFGIPSKGIDDLVPTKWNMKVMVERYE